VKVFVAKEEGRSEKRVSVTPSVVKKFVQFGFDVWIESEAGSGAEFPDVDYIGSGGSIVSISDIKDADVVASINPLSPYIVKQMKKEAICICMQKSHINKNNLALYREGNITSFALDLIPRTSRAQYMDVLSSQSSLAGYKAVIEAAHILLRSFPLMMTTAGTIPAAKILVLGAGVAGLQAIATAKRLGAVVSAFDVRLAAKEQVESLGAKFIAIEEPPSSSQDGVYAKEATEEYRKNQEEKLKSVLPQQDVIITTAQIPGKKAPILLTTEMIEQNMKKGAVVIDLASESGGNCELTSHGQIIEKDGVKIVSFENILSLIARDASTLFANNLYAFVELLYNQAQNCSWNILDIEDEIIKATLLTCQKEIRKEIN
jgi:NAD(P) transhydrogenase subunit alpha